MMPNGLWWPDFRFEVTTLFTNHLKNLFVRGEAAKIVLWENKITIYNDIEDAIFPFNEFCLCTEFIGYSGCQTGSLWEIVSNNAVSNWDFHFNSPGWHWTHEPETARPLRVLWSDLCTPGMSKIPLLGGVNPSALRHVSKWLCGVVSTSSLEAKSPVCESG